MALCQWLSAIKINSHIQLCAGVRELACQVPGVSCFQQHVRYIAKSTTEPNTGLCRGCQSNKARSSSNTQRQCTASKTIPVCLSVAVANLSSKHLQPTTPSPSSPLLCTLWRVSTDSNLRRGAPHPRGRSLLHARLAAAAAAAVAAASFWWYGCALLVGALYACVSRYRYCCCRYVL